MKFSYCHHRHSRPNHTEPALDIKALCVAYPSQTKDAISQLTLSVPIGKAFALVGSNGAGKSTLFKAVSGLLPIRSGTVRVFGHSIGACHHRVVYLPQRAHIDWQFPVSVLDLVLTGRYVYLGWFKRSSKNDSKKAMDALEALGVADLYERQISQLSGGQQQRVLIARAIVQNADLLLLDEPLNAVDAQTREVVSRFLEDIRVQGKTVITATHYYNKEDKQYDGVIFLKDGEQVSLPEDGHTHEEGCCG